MYTITYFFVFLFLFILHFSDSQGSDYITGNCDGASQTLIKTAPVTIVSHKDFDTPGASYLPYQNCQWLITAPIDKKIAIEFLNFSLDSPILPCGQFRDEDFVRIDEYIYCGNHDGLKVHSKTNEMMIFFFTNSKVSGIGFRGKITFVDPTPKCGETLQATANVAYLTNPNFDETHSKPYYPHLSCFWTIRTTDKNAHIKIEFLYFDVEGRSLRNNYLGPCRTDYLSVYDGEKIYFRNQIKKLCGLRKFGSMPNPVVSSTHTLKLRFVTDSSREYYGFKLKYYTIGNPSVGGTGSDFKNSSNFARQQAKNENDVEIVFLVLILFACLVALIVLLIFLYKCIWKFYYAKSNGPQVITIAPPPEYAVSMSEYTPPPPPALTQQAPPIDEKPTS